MQAWIKRLFILGGLLGGQTVNADTLALYTFTGSNPAPSSVNAFIDAAALSLSTQTLSYGTFAGFANPPYAQGSGGWNAANQESAKYFRVVLTALNNATFTPTNLSLAIRASNAGPSAAAISVNGDVIYDENMTNNVTLTLSFPLEGYTDLETLEVRVYGWLNGSRTANGNGDFRIDDILIQGTVDEPSGNQPPTVGSPVATAIGFDSATLGGSIGTSIGSDVNERGVYFSLTAGFTPPGQGTKVSETGTFGTGPFSLPVTGLLAGTTYYYRAFAANDEGPGFSTEASFKTLAMPPAGALVYYTFTGNSPVPEYVAPNVSGGNFLVSPGTVGFAWSNPDDWQALGAEQPYAISSEQWTGADQDNTKFFNFAMAAASGKALTITNISFIHRRSNTGPQDTGISINGEGVFAEALDSNVSVAVSVPLSGYSNLTGAVVRIQGWGASGTGSYQIDNVAVQGFVTEFVVPSNLPPAIALNPPGATKTIMQDEPLTFEVIATQPLGDADDATALSALSLPPGAVFASATGLPPQSASFAWTPTVADAFQAVFVASDKDGTTTQIVDIVVTPPPGNILAAYTFSATNLEPTAVHADLAASPLSANEDRSVGMAVSLGNPPPAAVVNGWHEPERWYTFTLDVPAGFRVTATNLLFDAGRSATGPTTWEVRASDDGDFGDTFGDGLITTNFVSHSVPIMIEDATGTLEVRIYGSGTAASNGTFRIDNIVLQGTVQSGNDPDPLDEPEVVLITAASGLPVVRIGASQTGVHYILRYTTNLLSSQAWTAIGAPSIGDGQPVDLADPNPADPMRVYQVEAAPAP